MRIPGGHSDSGASAGRTLVECECTYLRGAFQNPPEVVAGVFRKVMEEYRLAFDTVEYAVYCSERDLRNYEAFCGTMRR